MFPVRWKSRISHLESYPLKASEISNMLADVPQAEVLQIAFWRYSTHVDRASKILRLVRVSYCRRQSGISTSNYEITNQLLGPTWEIRVSPVYRSFRHRVNTLLIAEGVPRIKEWLLTKWEIHGHIGRESIRILYDIETDKLLYEAE